LVHGASNGSDELVVLEETGAIIVEVVEQLLHLTLGEAEHEISASFSEFIFIKRTRVVVIHDLKLSLETNKSAGTSRCKLLAHSFSELLGGTSTAVTTSAGGSHRSTVK
jgi:hypothetical protein